MKQCIKARIENMCLVMFTLINNHAASVSGAWRLGRAAPIQVVLRCHSVRRGGRVPLSQGGSGGIQSLL